MPPKKAAPQPAPSLEFKVRATRVGFNTQRRRVGDVFLVNEAGFSPVWMERVEADTPMKTQSSVEAARREHAALLDGPPSLQKNGADLEEDDDAALVDKPTGDKDVLQ